MGCDIHLHVELKINGKWEHYSNPNVDRDYELFGVMAGVRGEATPIVEPKGLPEDASIITRMDYELDSMFHNASWFNENEIDELRKWCESRYQEDYENKRSYYLLEYETVKTWLFGNQFDQDGLDASPDGVTNYRFVFWFDS